MVDLQNLLDIGEGSHRAPDEAKRVQASITRVRYLAVCALVLAAAVALTAPTSLAGTKFIRHWARTGEPMRMLHTVLVAAVVENYLIRQEFEDEMERQLAKFGIMGVRSHMVLPPRNELQEERELTDFIKTGGYDAVLVVHPKEMRKEREEKVNRFPGPAPQPPQGFYHLWPYWETTWAESKTVKVYTTEHTMVSAEINLYTVSDENLIWSGETDTVYTKDFQKLGREYAKALVNQLIKDKIIAKK